jgi:hypothetical protein
MDSKLFNDLVEAYQLVHSTENIEEKNGGASKKKETKFHTKLDKLVHKTFGKSPEEQKEEVSRIDEISANLALTASSKADEMRRKASVAGDKETAAKKAAQASRIYKGVGPRRTRERMGEEFDIFDAVLEFLQVEGYAETLEEAEWMMANLIDEEAVAIILGEEQLDELSNRTVSNALNARIAATGAASDREMKNRTPQNMRDSVRAADKEASMRSAVAKRRQRMNKEEFEAWLDEAMSSYEKNRKRAAARAEARNAARDQGKTGAVPGVGYVSPRREKISLRDKFGDAAGTRMAKAKPPRGDEKY